MSDDGLIWEARPSALRKPVLVAGFEGWSDAADAVHVPIDEELGVHQQCDGFTTLSEWDFIGRMAEQADCGLLLDVNNVYVSSVNHDFDSEEFIRSVPHERVVQFHLAGHTNCQTHLIDTHDNHVADPVWNLYRLAHQLTGGVSTLLEWDAKIPPFPVLHAEVLKAKQHIGTELADQRMADLPIEPEPAELGGAGGVDRFREESVVPHPLHHTMAQVA